MATLWRGGHYCDYLQGQMRQQGRRSWHSRTEPIPRRAWEKWISSWREREASSARTLVQQSRYNGCEWPEGGEQLPQRKG